MAPLLQATRTVPIVFVQITDPVGAGFVDSLARPAGNVTGFTNFEYGHARGEGKRLGRPPIAPALEKRIRGALATPGRPGVRVIAKQFGVNPGTVQRISRPFEQDAVAV
jgi:ABC transporter substrate binding protein